MDKRSLKWLLSSSPFLLIGITLMVVSLLLRFYIGDLDGNSIETLELFDRVQLFSRFLLVIGSLINFTGITILTIYGIIKISELKKKRENGNKLKG